MTVIVKQLTLARPELSKSTAFYAGQGQFGRRNIRRLGLEDRILAKVVNRASLLLLLFTRSNKKQILRETMNSLSTLDLSLPSEIDESEAGTL